MMVVVRVWFRAGGVERMLTFAVATAEEERAGREAWRVVLRRWPDAVGTGWSYVHVDGPLEL